MKPTHPTALVLALAAVSLTALVSCKPEQATTTVPAATESATMPDEGDAVFKDSASEQLFKSYSKLRTALVNSDAAAAMAAAAEIKSADPSVSAPAAAIAASDDLKAQRASFQTLVAGLIPVFQQNLTGGTIHIQHCPMAMAGKGADWISESTAILNPYYGSAMLKCGEVTKTITPAP
jgi:hypothetical protein